MNGEKPLYPDTSFAVERVLVEGYRKMSIQEKYRITTEMQCAGMQMAYDNVRRRYPDADEAEIKLRAASLWLPRDLMIKAFGWDPEIEGY